MTSYKLVIALVLATGFGMMTKAAQFHHEAVKKDADLYKRTPFLFPFRPFYNRHQINELDDEELEDSEFERKRRIPFFYANPKLWGGASQNVVSEEDENEMENVDDGFDRKRRIPYYYPHYGHFSGQMEADHDLEEMDEKRSLRKRGIPYYFPRLSYSFLPRMEEGVGCKHFVAWKRGAKRSLADALEHDDATDFGYDKRQSLMDIDDDEEDRRKKKRALIIKKSV